VPALTDEFLAITFGAALAFFALGFFALVARASLLRILLGLEIMGKGVTLALVGAGFALGQPSTSQAVVITVIAIEVVVIAIALAMVVRWHALTGTLKAPGVGARRTEVS